MSQLQISVAMGDYDRNRALYDGLGVPFGHTGVVGELFALQFDPLEPLISDVSRNRTTRTG